MRVRISKPTKSAMQSGDGNDKWQLSFVRQQGSLHREQLMARNTSNDMMNEVKLYFNTLEEAEKFAKERNYHYEVIKPQKRKIIKQAYADNFQ